MRMMFAVVFACIILAFTASGVAGGVEVGDWLSGGYVVTGYNAPAALKWSPSVFNYGYIDYSVSDPWYRSVARPYLDSWYWPSYYYRSGITVYPVNYYRPAYYWHGLPWPY